MMRQAPRIAAAVKRENSWLKEVIRREKIDGVISDNRLGLFNPAIPCVFITHQLRIQTGLGRWADDMAQLFNYRYINRFSGVWIPDFEGAQNLAGLLSHPSSMPRNTVSYVGALTRVHSSSFANKEGVILFVFSGPEPQRSIFEQAVLTQLKYIKQPVTIIRGKPLQEDLPPIDGVTVYNHLPVTEMEPIMRSAALIVCRSGYSSVMDINALRQRSVLIPTPGQTEQQYLAEYLMDKRFAISADQDNFNLLQLLYRASQFAYDGFINPDDTLLTKAVDAFLSDCRSVIEKS
ncbi:glycosyltransferase [Niabella hibiscisoli]|uniref:glycosyltransferase n=1 Tax=Niabella hibiscisoli TaxID=1825928 RepID=UPI001F0D7773|nr:glycosyltransferase [Niabella hibiscisoli]MCH5715283.1 glycosyl transferase family 28 [Niabella hibiscisoli]